MPPMAAIWRHARTGQSTLHFGDTPTVPACHLSQDLHTRREKFLTSLLHFDYSGNMKTEGTARYADMFAALGSEPRLQIVRLLLSAHPDGMIVSDIQAELGIPNSTLSHHLEKLRMEVLVSIKKDKQWLWYSANSEALQDLLGFLYAECCTRSKVVKPISITAAKARG